MVSPVPADPTGLTQIAEILDADYIDRVIELTPRTVPVGLSIVYNDLVPYAEANSFSRRIITSPGLTGAASVTFPNEAPEDSYAPTSENIDGERIALSSFVGDDTAIGNALSVFDTVILELVRAVQDKLSADALALFADFDESSGDANTEFDMTFWRTETGLFLSQLPVDGQRHAVLTFHSAEVLRADIATNAAALYSTAWGESQAKALENVFVGSTFMFGEWVMHRVTESQVPVGDTTGVTNALLTLNPGGAGSALQQSTWQPIKVVPSRGSQGERRFGTWLTCSTVGGSGIRSQSNGRALVSEAA